MSDRKRKTRTCDFPDFFLPLYLNKKIVFTTFMYHLMVVMLHFEKMALMLQEMRQIRDARLIVSLRIKTIYLLLAFSTLELRKL